MANTLGVATDQQYAAIPAGSYRVSLKEVNTEVESDFNEAGQIKWVFQVEACIHSSDDDAEESVGEELHGYSNKSDHGYNPGHKTRKWYEALLGRKLEVDEPMTIDSVIGKQAVANVVESERKDGTPTTKIAQDGGLSPYKKKKKGKPATQPEPEEVEDDEELEDSDSESEPF